MNAQEFETATGFPPQDDDLERANCPDAGKPCHMGCGVCEHGKPVFMCIGPDGCFGKTANDRPIRYSA